MKKTKLVYGISKPLGEDKECNLIKTECLSHLYKYQFDYFNPMQSAFLEHLDKNDNIIISSPTASGKSVVIELCMAFELNKEKDSLCVYLAPMKALCEEKLSDWCDINSSFKDYNLSILTGDFILNETKKKELMKANILCASSEMLDSKTRFYNSNQWLDRIKVLIIDESHLLGSDGRGDKLETAIMRFCKNNKNCKLVLISATAPNTNELAEWLTKLNNKNTIIINSDYRPCKLNKEYIKFLDRRNNRNLNYFELEKVRMNTCFELLKKYKDDKFLIFCGNKKWGRKFIEYLNNNGVFNVDFHNADLTREKRLDIENKFRNGDLKYLISSPTLAWGCNLPARRVILAHTSYGMTPMDVSDVIQSIGRSGRPKYDKQGDAYILLPFSKSEQEKTRLEQPFKITSKLSGQNSLLFHIVSEIASKEITCMDDFIKWYETTLSYHQKFVYTNNQYEKIIEILKNKLMIKVDDNNIFSATQLGYISAYMYQFPLDIYDWFENFKKIKKLWDENEQKNYENDINICWSLASVYSNDDGKNFKQYLSRDEERVESVKLFVRRFSKSSVAKYAAAYYDLLNGLDSESQITSIRYNIHNDLIRTISTLKLIDSRYASIRSDVTGWNYGSSEWDILFLRLKYGISRKLTELVKIPGVGAKYSEKLYKAGIKSENEFLGEKNICSAIMGSKNYEKALLKIQEKNAKTK